MNWMNTTGFGKIQSIMGKLGKTNSDLQRNLKDYELILEDIDKDGFKTTLKPKNYNWRSNGEILLRAQKLIFAYKLTNNKKYSNKAIYQLNYILGLNFNNMSYLTGVGIIHPNNIHHAIMYSDDSVESFPGLLAGGANISLDNDNTFRDYYTDKTPPAKCYVDDGSSWATNETAFYSTPPLIPVTVFFSI